jgi:hypothetical protein
MNFTDSCLFFGRLSGAPRQPGLANILSRQAVASPPGARSAEHVKTVSLFVPQLSSFGLIKSGLQNKQPQNGVLQARRICIIDI